MLTLKQIRYFVAAAETEKVSAAATSLGISQSAVTVAIKELEAQLGVSLTRRRVGGIELTQDGQKFLHHARNIEANIVDAMNSMTNKEAQTTGEIRLGVTYTGVGYFLLPNLARFRRAYPNVMFNIIEMNRAGLEHALHAGNIDLALIIVSNLSKKHGLRYRVLMRSPRTLWLSSGHRLNRLPRISLQDLRDEPYVQFASDEAPVAGRRYLKIKPKVILSTTSMEAVRGIVATGEAVTILAHLVYRPWSLDGGRVESRPIADKLPSLDLGIAWNPEKTLSEAERKFIDYLQNEGGSRPV
jgi:DNA-binding transcriptional LysR family regulator